MRVAWVTFSFEEYSALHVNRLCLEHDVLLVMPRACGEAPRYPIDSSVEHCEFSNPRLRQPLKQWKSVREIAQRIHDFRPDVVHLQQGHLWFNFVLGSLRRYPLVVTVHDPRHHAGDVVSRKTPQWVIDYGFRKADQVIVHGNALAVEVENLFGFQRECIHVIPHVAMGDETVGNDIEEDGNSVLFFGRIWDYKGLDQLIAAQPLISEALPDARILIAGEGEDFGRYRAMMKDPSKFIVHNAWISDQERASLFQKSAIVVLPYNEATQSGVIPNAYTFAKPVVSTRTGGLPESVDHEETGLLVPPRDEQGLAEAVIRLLKNPQLRKKMGRAGREKLDSEWSAAVVASQTVDVYRQALGLLSISGKKMGSHSDCWEREPVGE